jgi:hypothetical protein
MSEPNPTFHPHRHLEPFGEPRTMAVQWDLSSLVLSLNQATNKLPSGENDADLVEDDSLAAQDNESIWDKFPQPATIPAGWDLSELL